MAHGHPAVPRTGPEESKIRAGAQRARLQSQETDRYQGHARAAERASALASMNYARSLPHRSGRPSRFSHSLFRGDDIEVATPPPSPHMRPILHGRMRGGETGAAGAEQFFAQRARAVGLLVTPAPG